MLTLNTKYFTVYGIWVTQHYKCREYDHFDKYCPASKVEKESEQIQQMYNMDEEQIETIDD